MTTTNTGTGTSSTDPYREVLREAFVRRYEEGADSWSEEPAMRELVPLLCTELAAGSSVIDIGAGRGRDAELLLAAGHRVTAVDLVRLPDWDAMARRYGAAVSFEVGNFADMAGDPVYDAAVDNGVLHHQDPADYARYLANVRRRLRPGGLLAVSLFTTAEGLAEGVLHRAEDGRLSRWFSEREAAELLAGAGFTVTAVRTVRRELPGLAYLLVLARRDA
ncbi:class I SAM-dependent methyltransferase [Streptomyces roseoverticillatus]|uniref:class I SAM-dependent methyltransferase n=1 Tax=Streptomyces roseoverticillatus TaxID=66429 RepID=UPI001F295399|nr:class I SAM-dependent methyltransferase [Streptomyces roseoverticillatus]MCF3100350.1 class I SAM-dependent methyltransferase [Streptomyces roseoverticillatus]